MLEVREDANAAEDVAFVRMETEPDVGIWALPLNSETAEKTPGETKLGIG